MINDWTILQGAQALSNLMTRKLIPHAESAVLLETLKGEEGIAIAENIKKAWQAFETMPKTCDTQGKDDPTAYMHYFLNGWDWWITEKDGDTEEQYFFGFVKSDLCPDGEWGYISLEEITSNGAELDLYFTPAPLSKFSK